MTAATVLQRPGVRALLVISVAATLLPLWFRVPLWVAALSIVAWISAQLIRDSLPRFLLLGFVVAATIGVWLQHRNILSKDAGLSLIVLMASFKLLELKASRDAILLSAMSFFLLFVSMLFYSSLAVNFYLFLLLPLCSATLMAMHRSDGWSGLVKLSKDSSKFVLLAIPMMLVLYVFFPRLASPLWRLPNSAMSGPADSMTVGDVSSLALSDELSFRARFTGAVPSPADLYWRGTVLADFDGLTWTVGLPLATEELDDQKNFVSYEVQLQPTSLRWLYALDAVATVEDAPPSRRVWNGSIMASSFLRSVVNYKVTSALDYTLDATMNEKSRPYYLRLPERGNPKARTLGQSLIRQYAEPEQRVRALMRIINQEDYWYSLTVPELAEDVVDDFWFNHKVGFCEHYANAIAFILRAAEIPSRVVVGYQGGEWNEYGKFYTVRYRDAHAWNEYWIEGKGWLRLDPTSSIHPTRVDSSWLERVSQRDNEFNVDAWSEFTAKTRDAPVWVVSVWQTANKWYEANIVQFNADVQQQWFESFGLPKLDKTRMVQIMVFVVLGLMILSAFVIMRARVAIDPVARCYAAFCAKLARYGVVRAPGETPFELLRRAQRTLPAERAALKAFIDTYIALKYSSTGSEAALKKEWRALRFRRLRAL